MVAGLAFLATAIATVFAQATGRAVVALEGARTRAAGPSRWRCSRSASAALATGAQHGWDEGTFRVFYLLGAILNVPWLALGTVYLLFGKPHRRTGCATVLLVFTGLAVGVMLAAPIHGTIAPDGGIPVGKDHFGVLPARSPARRAASARSSCSPARCGRRCASRAAQRRDRDRSPPATR